MEVVIRTWRGKRFEDMTKDELIQALCQVTDRLAELNAPEHSHLRAKAEVERMKTRFTADPVRGAGNDSGLISYVGFE